jgi:hypothetical protein
MKPRNSAHLEKAKERLTAIKGINSNLDMGKGLSVQAFSDMIEKTSKYQDIYNTTLSMLNADRVAMEEAEKELKELTEKMLLGIAIEYGKDSPEYEVAGGTRTSKRKRPTRKAKPQSDLQAKLN